MELRSALRIDDQGRFQKQLLKLALVGSGGKTTVLFALARDLIQAGLSTVLVSASTHLAVEQADLADVRFVLRDSNDLTRFKDGFPPGICLFTRQQVEADRVGGLSYDELNLLSELADHYSLPLLIEADGSRQRPLKAPDRHEPALPGFVNLVIVVLGLTGIGKTLSSEWVHRPEQYARLSGLSKGDPITVPSAARVVCHAQGGLKNIPPNAHRVLLLNQADDKTSIEVGKQLASAVQTCFTSVLIGALGDLHHPGISRVYEPTAGIVLAAGGSSRFGTPKQLLLWDEKPLVHRAASSVLEAGLSPVVVVVGAYSDQVVQAVCDLPVKIMHNPDWQEGQASSIRAGLTGLSSDIGSAVFMLADQPLIPPLLVRSLVERHAETLAPIVSPRVNGQRANPALFDQTTFPSLLTLHGDTGGRTLMRDQRFSVSWVDWQDDSILLDVDTHEDYLHLSLRDIAAIVLAAGRSQRMGQPKMDLAWGETTVLGRVVKVIAQSGLGEILVVLGKNRLNRPEVLQGLPVQVVSNPPGSDEMVASVQTGLRVLSQRSFPPQVALIALGDQPQIELDVILKLLHFGQHKDVIRVPSYHNRRGHPWLLGRSFWSEVLMLDSKHTMRDFLNKHSNQIQYVNVDSDSILKDLDSFESYLLEKP